MQKVNPLKKKWGGGGGGEERAVGGGGGWGGLDLPLIPTIYHTSISLNAKLLEREVCMCGPALTPIHSHFLAPSPTISDESHSTVSAMRL